MSSVLDGLRAVAVLLVLADHGLEMAGHAGTRAWHPVDWQLGRLGVLLFFVHTAYVLMQSLQRTKLPPSQQAAHFFIRRAFRIYPLAMSAILVVWALRIPPLPWEPVRSFSIGEVAGNLVLSQNLLGSPYMLAPLWSLPLEIQMYLTLPAVFWWIRGGSGLRVAWLLWAAAVAAATVMPIGIARFAPCFLAGIIGYCLARRVRPRFDYWKGALALAGLIAAYLGLCWLAGIPHPAPAAWAVTLLAGVSVPRIHETRSRMVRAVCGQIAKYSYGIYLTHCIALWVGHVVLRDSPLLVQLAITVSLLVVLPIIAYHAIEAPLIRLGTRVAQTTIARLAQPDCEAKTQVA